MSTVEQLFFPARLQDRLVHVEPWTEDFQILTLLASFIPTAGVMADGWGRPVKLRAAENTPHPACMEKMKLWVYIISRTSCVHKEMGEQHRNHAWLALTRRRLKTAVHHGWQRGTYIRQMSTHFQQKASNYYQRSPLVVKETDWLALNETEDLSNRLC